MQAKYGWRPPAAPILRAAAPQGLLSTLRSRMSRLRRPPHPQQSPGRPSSQRQLRASGGSASAASRPPRAGAQTGGSAVEAARAGGDGSSRLTPVAQPAAGGTEAALDGGSPMQAGLAAEGDGQAEPGADGLNEGISWSAEGQQAEELSEANLAFGGAELSDGDAETLHGLAEPSSSACHPSESPADEPAISSEGAKSPQDLAAAQAATAVPGGTAEASSRGTAAQAKEDSGEGLHPLAYKLTEQRSTLQHFKSHEV